MSRPRTGYIAHFRIRFNECDPLGHVNNAVFLNFLEQTAIDHAAAVGWSSEALREAAGAVFVARRHEIDYLRPAFEGEWLRVITWPEEMAGARGYRHYEIARLDDPAPGDLVDRLLTKEEIVPLEKARIIVRARTEWAFMNVTTGRPSRIPAIVLVDFIEYEGEEEGFHAATDTDTPGSVHPAVDDLDAGGAVALGATWDRAAGHPRTRRGDGVEPDPGA
jgi:acyl-CoA thioester hydrolase